MPDDLGLADDGSAGISALRAARDADDGQDVSYETEASSAPTAPSEPTPATAEVETPTAPSAPPAAPEEKPADKPAPTAPASDGLVTLAQQIATLQQQFQALQKPATEPEKPAKPAAPDPTEDPIGYIQYAAQQMQEMREALDRQERDRVQYAQVAQIQRAVEHGVAAFRATAPDYDDAIAFMRASRIEELKFFGLTENQIQHAINTDAAAIIEGALASGQNPAERAYALAKMRGYQSKAAAPAAPASSPKLSGAALISHAAKVANAAGSLSQAPGGAPSSGPRTFAEYAALTPKARAALPPEVHARFRRDED